MIWLLALALGLLAGLVNGGRVDNFVRLKFRWPWLVIAAVVVRTAVLAPPLNHIDGAQWLYAASLGAIVLWAFLHSRRIPGIWLVGLGGLSNLAVILANGARMPVESALAGDLLRHGPIGQYIVMGAGTHLNALADWISIPPTPDAYSPGDLVIAAGLFLVAFLVARRRPEPGPIRPRRAV